jgi:hypothetical protein
MSIEKDLATIATNSERIAAALEKIAENGVATITISGEPAAEPAKMAPKTTEQKPKAAATTKDKPAAPEPKVEPEPEPVVETVVEPEPAADPLEEKPADASEVTVDQVRTALKNYRDIEGSAAMLEVLKKYGTDSLAGLKPDQYAAVLADVK